MWFAMSALGVLSLIGGVLQIPGVTSAIEHFFEGSFADSALFEEVHPSEGAAWGGLGIGAVTALAGIGVAYYLYVVAPGTTTRLRERFGAVHGFLVNKWYFDELIDAVVVRPVLAVGRFANSVFERAVVQGMVSGTVAVVRGAGEIVRTAQSGFVRAYALLVIAGFAGLALYFLIVSS
jgi:NADH-quinone oxidoreductase subunit L